MHKYLLLASAILAATIVTVGPAQDPGAAEPEVLTRGPIHEAYASTVNVQPQPGPTAPKPPPQNIEELPPDQKPEGDVTWVPGYWAWDDERNDYLWVSGFWRQPPPGRQWVPGAWRQLGDSWQWTSGFWNGATQQHVEYVPEPPAMPDLASTIPAPGENFTYVPGIWVYRETRFFWRPGYWAPFHPTWVWVPATYVWSPVGYVFVDGYWDYPLRTRGLMFAPVYFGVSFYSRPAYVYRPAVVVYDDALFGCLFVRPGFSAYYFGDYFDVRYRTGYRSWLEVRIGHAPDPLWGYYSRYHATTPGWSVSINATFKGRYSGELQRPARTLVQQNTIINNITNNKTTVINNTTVVNNVKNVTLAAPITKVDKTVIKLQQVTPLEHAAAVKTAKEVHQVAAQRVKLENQAIAAPGAKPGQPVQAMKLELPKTQVKSVQAPAGNRAPPPLPVSPKSDPKVEPKVITTTPKSEPKSPPPAPKSPPPPAPKGDAKTIPPNSTPKSEPKIIPPNSNPTPKSEPKSPPPPAPKSPPPPAPKSPPPPAPKSEPKTPPPTNTASKQAPRPGDRPDKPDRP